MLLRGGAELRASQIRYRPANGAGRGYGSRSDRRGLTHYYSSFLNKAMDNKPTFKNSVLGIQSNLMSFAMKLTLDKEVAQDLVQETTLKALDNEEKYAENTNFKGWMLTIMRNIFINNYRKAARENTMVDTTTDLYHIANATDTSCSTPDGAIACTEISRILAGFPAESREAFNMHIAGYKYEEIAERLSMPLGTVKARIFNTRKKLRELLKDYRD